MNGWQGYLLIVRRSLRQHAVSSGITVFAIALGAGLIMAVFSINRQSYNAFTGGALGFDAVLGARGSQLQLVLNAVFHLETSPGNIPWKLYTQMRDDPRVSLAVPMALGDNYYGYRIVGTSTELFTDFTLREDETFGDHLRGRVFDPRRREAIVGSTVAAETGLSLGDVINPYHGLVFDPSARHSEEYIVVGVMEPTNTPADRVIWIPIDGIFRMEGHVLRGTGEEYVPESGRSIPDQHKEVSAVLLNFANPQAGFFFDQLINRQGKVATLAWPLSTVMADFFNKMGWVNQVLVILAYLIAVTGGCTVLAGISNAMNERRREFAILRSLGASRRTLFTVILLESAALTLLGSIVGYGVYGVVAAVAAGLIQAQTGVAIGVFVWHPAFWVTPLGMVLLGILAGLMPAWNAYRTDVAGVLQRATG